MWRAIFRTRRDPPAWSRTAWINDGTWDAQIGWGGVPGTITLASTTTINLFNVAFGGPTGQGGQNNSGAYTVTGGTLNLSSGTVSVNAAVGPAVIASTVTGINGLYKTGSGALTLSGANTYSGATTINAGALLFEHAQFLAQWKLDYHQQRRGA